jgi:hypothetical protein
MTARPVPQRHWRSYGDHPLPTGPEALAEPLAAVPSWYLRITCDRCGKDRMVNEVHMPQRDLPLRDILDRMRRGRLRPGPPPQFLHRANARCANATEPAVASK